jgi:O-antigen ligase
MRRPANAMRAPPIALTPSGVGETIRRAWAPANQAATAAFAGALLLLFAAAVFGGASQGNALSLMAVEIASLPLLFVSLYLVLAGAAPQRAAVPLILLAGVVATPLLQLVPLPPGVWTRLPGRGAVAQTLDVARLGRPWLAFSLAPEQTWRAAMALAPPAAMFMGALILSDRQRRVLAICWLALAAASLAIGALQMLGGEASPLYFYPITNLGAPVGMFSNRNHQAEFLLCLIPVAAVFAARFNGDFEDRRAFAALLAALYIVIAIVGIAVTRSRAGVVLGGLALLAAGAVIARGGALRRHWRGAAGVAGGGALAIAAVLMYGLAPILDRFGAAAAEPRFEDWPLVARAASAFLPLGSGLGSFQTVYDAVEPLADVSPVYFNHAHNDYLELWLETGVVGLALLLAFALWLAKRAWTVWTRGAGSGRDLAAACSATMLLLAAHSAVDYPLRTEALAVLFAFAAATLAVYRPSDGPRAGSDPPRAPVKAASASA